MRKKIEQLTERDIRKFKRDIEGYEKTKRLFLTMGFVAMGLAIFFLVIAIVFGVFAGISGLDMNDFFSYEYFGVFLSLCITTASFSSSFFIYMLLMFILRSVLFAKKTANRQYLIEEYELYQEELKKQPNAVTITEEEPKN